jgi:hypothetical protein
MELRLAHVWTALAALGSAVAVFAGGYWTGMASGAAEPTGAAAVEPYPDWFLPIWDAYGRNPAVWPDFDFASLYSARIDG